MRQRMIVVHCQTMTDLLEELHKQRIAFHSFQVIFHHRATNTWEIEVEIAETDCLELSIGLPTMEETRNQLSYFQQGWNSAGHAINRPDRLKNIDWRVDRQAFPSRFAYREFLLGQQAYIDLCSKE